MTTQSALPAASMTDEEVMILDSIDKFLETDVKPFVHQLEHDDEYPQKIVDTMKEMGLFGLMIAPEFGGFGVSTLTYARIIEKISTVWMSVAGIINSHMIMAMTVQRCGTDAQKDHYLPRFATGELRGGIGLTEPDAGTDLQAIRTTARKDGNHYVLNGTKTYITNGQNTDLTLVVAKTDPDAIPAWKGMSIILVESDRAGFRKGRNLDKIGQEAADTSELFFDDVRVPITHCLGEEGKGFTYLMSQLPQERLSIAISVQASAQKAFDETVAFTKDRKAFAGVVFDFQNTRFVLAGLKAKLQVGWAHLDWAIARHLKGALTNEEGAAAKLWHSELQWEVMDQCLQLHGGAGYMTEYPIARSWRAARVSRIYGGTSEIMKEVIGRKL